MPNGGWYSLMRRAARPAIWPLRRLLDPRFADLTRRIGNVAERSHDELDETRTQLARITSAVSIHNEALVELAQHVGDRLDRFDASTDEINRRLVALDAELDGAVLPERMRAVAQATPAAVDEGATATYDLAAGLDGPATEAGVQIEPPLRVRRRAGAVEVGEVTRTAIEEPWAMRSLGEIDLGARIHVASAAPSAIAIALAALGYAVESAAPAIVDHPRLTTDRRRGSCAAAVALGVLDTGDRVARLAALRETLVPDGVLVLSLRVGVAADPQQDLLDPSAVARLLAGWTVLERLDVARTGATTWETASPIPADGLALVRARPLAA